MKTHSLEEHEKDIFLWEFPNNHTLAYITSSSMVSMHWKVDRNTSPRLVDAEEEKIDDIYDFGCVALFLLYSLTAFVFFLLCCAVVGEWVCGVHIRGGFGVVGGGAGIVVLTLCVLLMDCLVHSVAPPPLFAALS